MNSLPTLIGNYLDAAPGPEKDDAALLLSMIPENQPGEDVSFEVPMSELGAAKLVPFRKSL